MSLGGPATDSNRRSDRTVQSPVQEGWQGDPLGHSASRSTSKRILDVIVSLAAIIFFGPLMVVIAITIKIFDPGPVLFSHQRIGRNGESFGCLKFRTMSCDAERRLAKLLDSSEAARREWHELQKLSFDPRVTPLGGFLRASSLDELPQFFNVLRGDMSIVGPRPIVEEERPRYGRFIHSYCSVKPGLTGLWQVSGRNQVSYRRRVATDVFYCRNGDLGLDLWIMIRTPVVMIKGTGQ